MIVATRQREEWGLGIRYVACLTTQHMSANASNAYMCRRKGGAYHLGSRHIPKGCAMGFSVHWEDIEGGKRGSGGSGVVCMLGQL